MAKIKRTSIINAPVEKVFSFTTGDPNNLPKIYPSLIEVKNIKPSPVGGFNFSWVYKMVGVRFEGDTETIEYIKNQRIVTKSKQHASMYTYETENGGTKLIMEMKYTVPIPLLGKISEAVIVKLNENEINVVIANLKVLVES